MGTLSTTKFIKNIEGTLTEVAALTTSAGSGDSNKLPALNASGFLDSSIINSKTTSVGSSDSGKVPALDATGKLDTSFLPVGLGLDTGSIVTSEALSAGDFVNITPTTGLLRKADATSIGKEAHGFVLSSFGSGVPATVYFEGSNTSVTGQTPGVVFLSTTAGMATSNVSSYTGGKVIQRIGFAYNSTTINFQSDNPIITA